MPGPHNRRIKLMELEIGGLSFECQVQNWELQNNTEDGEKLYSQCPDGETREEADPDWALVVTFFADWRLDGISDYLQQHDQDIANFVVHHHPDIPAEHVWWSGSLKIKAPGVNAEGRATEMTETTMQIIGEPEYDREVESS